MDRLPHRRTSFIGEHRLLRLNALGITPAEVIVFGAGALLILHLAAKGIHWLRETVKRDLRMIFSL